MAYLAFMIVFAMSEFSAKVSERSFVAIMIDTYVQSFQSSLVMRQFSRQLVTVGKLLFQCCWTRNANFVVVVYALARKK